MEQLDIRSDTDSGSVESVVMPQGLTKRKFVLLALGLLLVGPSATLANDDDLEALNQRVDELFKQGKYQEAIAVYQHALALHPGDERILNEFGAALENSGDWQQAEKVFMNDIAAHPETKPTSAPAM